VRMLSKMLPWCWIVLRVEGRPLWPGAGNWLESRGGEEQGREIRGAQFYLKSGAAW